MEANRGGGGFGARCAALALGSSVGALIGVLALELDLAQLVSFWGQRAPLVVAGTALGAVAWATRLRALFAAAAGLLLVVWLSVAFTPLCAALARDLVRRDPPGAADAVFVFSANVQADGDLSPSAVSRVLHGLTLVAAGDAPVLVISELPPPTSAQAPEVRRLLSTLAPRAELLTIGPVRTTRDEARLLGELARGKGWARLLAVTSPTHSRRACGALEHEGLRVTCSPCRESRFDIEALDRPDDRLAAFGSILHERVGLIAYRQRGWID